MRKRLYGLDVVQFAVRPRHQDHAPASAPALDPEIELKPPTPEAAAIAPEVAPEIPIRVVQQVIANRAGCTITELTSHRRAMPVLLWRQIAMYLLIKLTTKSTPHIGRYFGRRDHTTVLHSVKKIEAQRAIDPELNAVIESLLVELGGEG